MIKYNEALHCVVLKENQNAWCAQMVCSDKGEGSGWRQMLLL